MINTFDEYASTPGLNWSTLKHLHTSPLLLRHRADHPEPDKKSYQLGRAIHCAVLEPERWPVAYPAAPDFGNLRTKAARADRDAWEAEHGTALSPADRTLCETVRDAVRGHKVAAKLLAAGRAEVSVQWERDGVACKARLDFLRPAGIVDLKTTRCRNLREFTADAARYLYHGQVSWYDHGARAAGLIAADAGPPYIIAAQTVAPHDVWAIRVAGLALSAGHELCRALLAKYRACQSADYWPGIAPDEVDLELPTWAAGMQIDDEEEDWA